ncbi:EAL domain-containing protein [Brevundimonas faecalis]|uniref:EAL domain-containing protein (Putative c-di-GMP-specific phosphodiesterase class I) n=1 Tax=Brevundimonas faecalis TaxID=947378 RepID=A0ABV2RDL6_9CAUL
MKPRLLGMAFAAADALFEIDGKGKVALALGSGPVTGQAADAWIGRAYDALFIAASCPAVAEAVRGLAPGGRSDPLDVLVDCGDGLARPAVFRAFMLPDLAPAVSCSLVYGGSPVRHGTPAPTELADAEAFMTHARDSLSAAPGHALHRLALAFIEVQGLTGPDEAQNARAAARIGTRLQQASHDGLSAGRLTANRYAVVRNADDVADLETQVQEAGRAEGLTLTARTDQTPLGSDPLCALRAMRFAIEGCLRDDASRPELSFADSLARTLKDADRFRGIVRDREFALFYQPIVDLKTRAVHHFEALARFGQGGGPAPAIRMAEELALIEDFDLVVAEKVVSRLRQPGSGLLKIALNVSGASLAHDAYVAALLRMTAPQPELRRRLMVEVTETAALADIAAANRRLGALRDAGIKVCIDDFGAGSAAFDYLRGLSVDTVKIDGSLVQGAADDARTRTLIGHLVELCGSLNLTTVAEMIETEDVAQQLQSLGVDQGQGWLFGRAEAEPVVILPTAAPRARRQGVVEAWG